jgi:hypothetical protein
MRMKIMSNVDIAKEWYEMEKEEFIKKYSLDEWDKQSYDFYEPEDDANEC